MAMVRSHMIGLVGMVIVAEKQIIYRFRMIDFYLSLNLAIGTGPFQGVWDYYQLINQAIFLYR
jgi:hypothetical protein